MSSEKLHTKLIDIGVKAKKIYDHNLMIKGRWITSKKEGEVFIIDKASEEYFYGMNHQKPIDELLKELNDTFYELLYKSHKENYFFLGSSYEIINKWVESNSNEKINPIEGFDENDFFSECLSRYDNILKIIDIDKYQLYHFEKENCFYFLLNKKNRSIVERNLSKARDYIENINLERNENYEDNIDHVLSPKEKIIYLNELGIIDYLYKNNDKINPMKLGKILEILIEENNGNLRKIIASLRNENFDGFYPYASEKSVQKVKELLILKGWNES